MNRNTIGERSFAGTLPYELALISLEEKLQRTSKKHAFQLRKSSEAVVKNLRLRA